MSYTLRDYQQKASDAAVQFFQSEEMYNALLVLPTGCHAEGTPIVMADGTIKRVEEIVVGDKIMGDDGTPRNVLSLHRGKDDMYRITPIKGKPFVVNGGHILHLYKTNEGKDYPSCYSRYDEISVSEYVEKSNNYKHLHKLHHCGAVEFNNDFVTELDPYFVGLLLGDGSVTTGISVTTMEPEVRDYLYEYANEHGYTIRDSCKPNNKAHTYHIKAYGGKSHQWFSKSELRTILEREHLFGKVAESKYIPQQYKLSSIDNRKRLLAGLIDTDCFYDAQRNNYEYCSKSSFFIYDVQFLCRSLGLFCEVGKVKVVNGEEYYRCTISGDLTDIPIRVNRRKQVCARKQKKSHLVTGFSVEKLGIGDYYGFTLDGNHLYIDNQFFVHHNSGKSLIISDISNRLGSDVLVFCPSREIVIQNYNKMKTYTDDCSMFSASVGQKEISKITFAMIGSAKSKVDDFKHFKYVMVDEAHFVNGEGGMYMDFLRQLDCKVLGLTATPFRLYADTEWDYVEKRMTTTNSRLVMLTNDENKFFEKIIYKVQVKDLLDKDYLAHVQYLNWKPKGWNEDKIFKNSTGAEYSAKSVQWMMENTNHLDYVIKVCRHLLSLGRKHILVFVQFTDDAQELCEMVGDSAFVTGETTKKNRERILDEFKSGKIKVLANVNCLSTGFDFPELDTVVLARPTLSLALHYQQCLSMETEILTKRGWMNYSTICKDDAVAAFDNGKIVWTEIEDIIHRNTYDGEQFVSFNNNVLDFKVTGEHNLLVKSPHSKSGYSKEFAIDAIKRKAMYVVPVSGIEESKGLPFNDDEISLLGWLVSDGGLNKIHNSIHIVQSLKNKDYCDEIESLLNKCNIRYHGTIQKRTGELSKYSDAIHYCINHGDARRLTERGKTGWSRFDGYYNGCKKWNDKFDEMTEHQFDLFIKSIYNADGAHRKAIDWNPQTMTICCGINKEYVDRLQSLAIRKGYRANISVSKNRNYNDIYVLYLKKITYSTISGTNISNGSICGKKEYHRSRPSVSSCDGKEVWCVRNVYGTIVTRRNGKVMIMGNCGRVLRPFPNKDAWIIDTVGNINRFGCIDNLRLEVAKATGLEEMFGYVFDYDERKYKWKALTAS